ncbi:MAG: thiolase family protein [Desulfobacterales bacterium]
MRDVYIIGAGMTRFGLYDGRHLPYKTIYELGAEACMAALDHAGISHRKIEAAFCGNGSAPPNCCQNITAPVGISGVPAFNHENGCAAGSCALKHAWETVANGMYDVALVIGADKWSPPPGVSRETRLLVTPSGMNLNQDVAGAFGTALLALIANAHMHEYGTTREQLAKIAVKNKRNGAMNPYAQFQKEVTLEDVLHSRMISDPLTLLQCCPQSDGAAAVVICTGDIARQYTSKPIKIPFITESSARYKGMEGRLSEFKCFQRASQSAYEACGIGPDDLDIVEVHDDFTALELVAYEDLGLCPKGEAGRCIDEGRFDFGGKCVVSPSGGLLAKGHPIGATGVAQLVEIAWQLRGECGKRQVDGAKIGLAHNGGGVGDGYEPGAVTITIATI